MKTIDNKFEIGEECYTYARENMEITCPVCKGTKKILFFGLWGENMKMTGIIRRVYDLGRVVIPKEIRRQVFGKTDASGEPMEIFIDGENIILRKYEDKVVEWWRD